jgi:GNAT superfamily N-acetyltransferase
MDPDRSKSAPHEDAGQLTTFIIRPLVAADEEILRRMSYQAIFVPDGSPTPDPEIVLSPELARYHRGWGRPGDMGHVVIDVTSRRPVGAAWLRLLTGEKAGYGYVDDNTPELSIAVIPECRGQGLGTSLLEAVLTAAAEHYDAVSLSVSIANPAVRLYRRLGFQTVYRSPESLVMVKQLGDVRLRQK